MKNNLIKYSGLVIFLVNLIVCGIIINLGKGDYIVYGGVRNDFNVI